MRQSHMVFILLCGAWVSGASLYGLLYYPEYVEKFGLYGFAGEATFWLWPLGLGYSIYLMIQKRQSKAKEMKNVSS